MSVSRHHADWLSLLESSGPFLSLPVVLRAFPQGLDPRDPEQAKQLRLAYEEWHENPTLTAKQRAWVMHVLSQVLLHPKELLAEGQTLPPGLMATMAEYGEILRPELALIGPVGSEVAGKPQLLISLYPVEQSLDKPVTGKHWKATPGTRMMELLHATDVPLGLVTNGEQWTLVFAPRGDTTGLTSWYASLWIDEPITLRAFHSLLSTRRFFGVAPSDTLLALLKESAQDQQEVTNQLGDQVRDAVEVLIQAFDRLDQDSGRTLLKGLDERSLYDAALTVMMRLVFLFSAEERGLLHFGESLYNENYAVSTLREQLQEVADRYGEEVLERRHDGWARLLATFRAVHGGVNHQDLMLPAYGGSLFDADRYPFLEGRAQGTAWQSSPAVPLEINNRVVLHLLKSLQMLQVKVPGGGPAEALRVSFEGLNIEQIGHVYEGLLDHTAVRAKEVVLGLSASRKKPVASIALADLEKLRRDDKETLIEVLEEETGRSARALENAFENGGELEDLHKLLVACAQDKELAERIIPFRGLLRQDSFERLIVVLPQGIYVGQDSARRSTGTHYTPRSLTEPIVQHTLEPLVYQGPADGLPKEQWRLRSPKEILDLKVCDMAMGSGAFLVQACRYLSERLVEAWENVEKEHPDEVLVTPEGGFSQGEPSERLIPKEVLERLAIARRVVADRCLYGVDINPMAVEMAKLSIWLITVDKSRPFTFLDHALKCGDSLLGVSSLQQIENFSLRPGEHQITFSTVNLFRYVEEASTKRKTLEAIPSENYSQIETKNSLHAEAEAATAKVKILADALIAFELRVLKGKRYDDARTLMADEVGSSMEKSIEEFRAYARGKLNGSRPFHWPLEFPEVFGRGGFDAVVGNPPYMGGTKVSNKLGQNYLYFLIEASPGSSGNSDLATFFVARSSLLIIPKVGALGLVTTSSILAGDSYRGGIGQLLDRGFKPLNELSAKQWPGEGANVAYVALIMRQAAQESSVTSRPYVLAQNDGLCNRGADVFGEGFILSPDEVSEWKQRQSPSLEVVMPYLGGAEFNNDPGLAPNRYIINFGERTESEAKVYAEAYNRAYARVRPARQHVQQRDRRELWWLFATRYPAVVTYFKSHSRCIAIAQMSKHLAFALMSGDKVFSNSLLLFLFDSFAAFGVLQSSLHATWVGRWAGAMRTDTRYTSTDCFETFPFPADYRAIERSAQEYYDYRQEVMLSRQEGLTKMYNRFHDNTEESDDIARLRALHTRVDQDVAIAYGWSDLDLGHGFHETAQGSRFTMSEAARQRILDRLVVLNRERYEEEVRAGLHVKKVKNSPSKRSSRKNKIENDMAQGGLSLKSEPLV